MAARAGHHPLTRTPGSTTTRPRPSQTATGSHSLNGAAGIGTHRPCVSSPTEGPSAGRTLPVTGAVDVVNAPSSAATARTPIPAKAAAAPRAARSRLALWRRTATAPPAGLRCGLERQSHTARYDYRSAFGLRGLHVW